MHKLPKAYISSYKKAQLKIRAKLPTENVYILLILCGLVFKSPVSWGTKCVHVQYRMKKGPQSNELSRCSWGHIFKIFPNMWSYNESNTLGLLPSPAKAFKFKILSSADSQRTLLVHQEGIWSFWKELMLLLCIPCVAKTQIQSKTGQNCSGLSSYIQDEKMPVRTSTAGWAWRTVLVE